MLTKLKLANFRCFPEFETEFAPGLNLVLGPNAHGKTSLLEAACVLLRLQSPKSQRLAEIIRHESRGLVTDGYYAEKHLQFYFSERRKKLALDSVEQRSATEYLQTGRVIWFSNSDIELVRGPAETRRHFLDFVAAQSMPDYRRMLRDYTRALRSRNLLLKAPVIRWKEIAAFDVPLIESGNFIAAARTNLCTALKPLAQLAHAAISGCSERLDTSFLSGSANDLSKSLELSRTEDLRLRQTTVGPHRDDWEFTLGGLPASLGSEGQQRTIALGLRLSAARYLEAHFGQPPLLLLDDIFGELDLSRRAALLRELSPSAQQLLATTEAAWLPDHSAAHVIRLGPRPSC